VRDFLDPVVVIRPRNSPAKSPGNVIGLGAAFEYVRRGAFAERQALKAVPTGHGEAAEIRRRKFTAWVDPNDGETVYFVRWRHCQGLQRSL
jgi:hypothetical protein